MQRLPCFLAVLALSCGSRPASPPAEPVALAPPATPPAVSLAEVGLDPAAMDRGADPCDNFYQYACGGWIQRAQIPPDKNGVSRFDEMADRNAELLHQILEQSRRDDPVRTQIGAFYAACMDEAAATAAGTAPLAPLLAAIGKVKDPRSLLAAVAELHASGVWVLFSAHPQQDFKDATRMILGLAQDGFGLPEKDYYFRNDDKTKAIRAAYQDNVDKLLVLAGQPAPQAGQAARDVLAVETALAKVAMPLVERFEPEKTYHPTDPAGLATTAPGIDWSAYLAALGRPDISRFNVESPAYLAGVSKLIRSIPAAKWRSYLAWHVVRELTPALPPAFEEQDLVFRQKLTGQLALPPRWKRCVGHTDDMLGELLARPYIQIAFGGDSKARAEKVITSIIAAMDRNLDAVAWMDEVTRKRAHEKIKKMLYLVGYPSRWKEYDFPVGPVFLDNMIVANRWHVRYDLGKVGKPVDRTEWKMTPPTVNAYYDPSLNEMVYPAGILQPPFFSARAAWTVNFGGIGMVAGHELTHGFDSNGALFDGDGNMSGWWEKAVVERFRERTACVERAYSELEGLPGEHVNGRLTLGENIADIGGVKLALSAARALRSGQTPVEAAGLDEDQLFFLGFAQGWCAKMREEAARVRLQTDAHSPPHVRVNGSLRQIPAFADAYRCKPEAKMRAENVCAVW